MDGNSNRQRAIQPIVPPGHIDALQRVRVIQPFERNFCVECPDLHSVLNDHKSEHDPWEVLDPSLLPLMAISLHALPTETHCLRMYNSLELILFNASELENRELDDQYGTGVGVGAKQLGILLDRCVVPPEFLVDEVGHFVVETILSVGANANLQLEKISQCSRGCRLCVSSCKLAIDTKQTNLEIGSTPP